MALAIKIGQLAKEGDVTIETVRFYERLNLLAPAARLPSGYRLYDAASVKRLRFIKNAQALGFTLPEIAELLNLRVSSTARCGDVQRKAQAKLQQVEDKIRDLRALARGLRALLQHCREGQPTERCPILRTFEEPQERNGGDGQSRIRAAGPRYPRRRKS